MMNIVTGILALLCSIFWLLKVLQLIKGKRESNTVIGAAFLICFIYFLSTALEYLD